LNKSLEKLIKLQEIDTRLYEIEELKGDLPEKVKTLTAKIESLKTENTESLARIEEIEKETRASTQVIEDSSSKHTRFKDQLYLVTSNKEYDALLKEIDTVKNEIAEAESSRKKLDIEKTSLEELVKENELKIESISSGLAKNKKELKVALSETETEEAELNDTRDKFIVEIEPGVLREYDKFRHARGGHGIISISRGACGSCYYSLPPQMVIEVRRRDKFIKCPSCGIQLFYDDTE